MIKWEWGPTWVVYRIFCCAAARQHLSVSWKTKGPIAKRSQSTPSVKRNRENKQKTQVPWSAQSWTEYILWCLFNMLKVVSCASGRWAVFTGHTGYQPQFSAKIHLASGELTWKLIKSGSNYFVNVAAVQTAVHRICHTCLCYTMQRAHVSSFSLCLSFLLFEPLELDCPHKQINIPSYAPKIKRVHPLSKVANYAAIFSWTY